MPDLDYTGQLGVLILGNIVIWGIIGSLACLALLALVDLYDDYKLRKHAERRRNQYRK